MNRHEAADLILRGLLASLEEKDRAVVNGMVERMKAIIAESNEHGRMAIALIGAAFAAQDSL